MKTRARSLLFGSYRVGHRFLLAGTLLTYVLGCGGNASPTASQNTVSTSDPTLARDLEAISSPTVRAEISVVNGQFNMAREDALQKEDIEILQREGLISDGEAAFLEPFRKKKNFRRP